MIQQEVSIPPRSRVVFISDVHCGHSGFRPDIFDDVVKYIKETPNTYWIGLGDYVEGREPGHKFYDAYAPMEVGQQYDYVLDRLRTIADKCLGMHIGNHEATLIQKTTINPIKTFCVENGIRYLGDVGRTVLRVNGRRYTILTAHGAGAGSKVGGNMNRLVDWAKTFTDVDVVCVGHYHKLAVSCELSGYIDRNGLQRWSECYVIISGSMLEAYHDGSDGSYVEKAMLPPSVLGYAEVRFTDKGKGLTVQLHPY